MQGALQTVRVRGQVNLILRAPRAVAGARAAPVNTSFTENFRIYFTSTF